MLIVRKNQSVNQDIGTTKQAARNALESLPNISSSWVDWCYGDTPSGEVGWAGVDQTDALHQGDNMMQFGRV